MAFSKEALDFLMENKLRDSKEWFREHRKDYDRLVLDPMRQLVLELQPGVWKLDDSLIAEPKVGRSISRIYRDTRFTKDKSTFRDVCWCVFLREKKLYQGPPAFYFEFSPRFVRWGCGYYRASPRDMDTLRGLILRQDPDFYKADKAVGKNGYFLLEGDRYKRSKFPQAQGREKLWLDQKNVAVAHTCSPEEAEILFSPQLAQKLEKDFKKLQPVYDFFCKVQTLSFEQTQQEDTPLPKAPRQQFDW